MDKVEANKQEEATVAGNDEPVKRLQGTEGAKSKEGGREEGRREKRCVKEGKGTKNEERRRRNRCNKLKKGEKKMKREGKRKIEKAKEMK